MSWEVREGAAESYLELTTGWRSLPLGEICREDRSLIESDSPTAKDRPYVGLENIESQSGRINRGSSAALQSEGISTTFAFDSRHVLYGKLRPYLNKVAMPEFSGRCTTELIPLLPGPQVSRDFLAWLLRRSETVAAAMSEKTGSRMPRADMASLFSLRVPLPSLVEQKRITALLTEQMAAVDKARAAAQAKLDALKALMSTFVEALFCSEAAPTWPKKSLREMCAGSGMYGTSQKNNAERRGLPVLRMGNIIDGALVARNLAHVELSEPELEKFLLAKGDIIFNRTNSAELVGKTAVFNWNEPTVFASYLVRFRLVPGTANPHWVARYINSRAGRGYVRQHMGRAIGQVNISASTMARLEIPCPGLPLQLRLMEELEQRIAAARQASVSAESELAAINALPAALLRRAFSGELSSRKPVPVPLAASGLEHRLARRALSVAFDVNHLNRRRQLSGEGAECGSVLLQKSTYLREAWARTPLGGRYNRQPLGPHDPDWNEVLGYAVEQGWVRAESLHREHPVYLPGPSMSAALKQTDALFGVSKAGALRVAELLSGLDWERAELYATVFAAWNDLRFDSPSLSVTDEQVIREVQERWHRSKSKFSQADLRGGLRWLREQGLEPAGVEPRTEVGFQTELEL